MGSEPLWAQTFSEELVRRSRSENKHSHWDPALVCFLFILITEISRGSVGSVEAQWRCQGGFFPPSQRGQCDHTSPCSLCVPSHCLL